MASSELYEELKDKLRIVLSDLKILTKQSDIRNVNGEALHQHEKTTQRLSSQAQSLIKDLENEIYQAPMSFQAGMNREVKRFKYELESIERLTEQKSPYYMRQASYGKGSTSQSTSPMAKELSEQSNLLLGHKSLKRATESIARSQVISAENEAIGNGILSDLGSQREQLHNTRDRLEDTNVEITRSQKLLKSIHRNVVTNKIFLIFFIFMELIVLGCVLYLKLRP